MLRGSDRRGGKYPYMEVMENSGWLHVWILLYVMEKKKEDMGLFDPGEDRVKIMW